MRLTTAELALDKGQLLGDRGEADLALLWLTRGLQLAPRGAADLQAAIRQSLAGWRDQASSVRLAIPHDGWASAVAIAPDGTFWIVHSKPESATMTVVRRDPLAGPVGAPLVIVARSDWGAMAFSPAVDRFLIGFVDGRVELYDLAAGKSLRTFSLTAGAHATSATFSPDGTTVLIGSDAGEDGGLAQLFEVATARAVGPALPHPRPVHAAAFRPDGKVFVTECGRWGNATEKVEARFWNPDGTSARGPLAHECMAPTVAISPDGERLLTGHWDFKARLWNLANPGEPIILPHDGPVINVGFSADGRTIRTASFDGTVRFWDLAGSALIPPLRHTGLVQSIAVDRKGTMVLVSVRSENSSRLWDIAAAGQGEGPARSGAGYFPLAFSPDRQTILTRDEENIVRLRVARTRHPVGESLPHPHPVLAGAGLSLVSGQRHACSSDRSRAVTVDEDNVARLWNTTTGTRVATLNGTPWNSALNHVFATAFSPDGRLVVTGTFDAKARVWDADTGVMRHLVGHEEKGPVFNITFSPDGRILATAGADGTVRFWDPVTGQPSGPPLRHSAGVMALAFSPDGQTLATGGTDVNVHLWDVAARTRRRRLSGHQGGVNVAAFAAHGRLLVTGSRDRTARLWDVATGKPIGPPMRHRDPVVRAAFGLDDNTILTATEDQMVHEWPVPAAMTGTADQLEVWAQAVTGMELEPDGGVHVLDAAEWASRRDLLLGTGLLGPPAARR